MILRRLLSRPAIRFDEPRGESSALLRHGHFGISSGTLWAELLAETFKLVFGHRGEIAGGRI